MGNILRKAVEVKRKSLIDQLNALNSNRKEDQYYSELTLTELENEYRRFQSQCHPHGDLGSLKWKNKKSKQ